MKVSFEGIGEMVATFPTEGEVAKGSLVKLTAEGSVSPCSAGDAFSGLAVSVRAGAAGVQFSGLAQIKYTGTAPVCGWAGLSADGSGGIQAAEGGREYLVVAVDPAVQTAVVRL